MARPSRVALASRGRAVSLCGRARGWDLAPLMYSASGIGAYVAIELIHHRDVPIGPGAGRRGPGAGRGPLRCALALLSLSSTF
jgi:hypothetical protein